MTRLFGICAIAITLAISACALLGVGRPAWVLHPPEDVEHLYFVGMASGAESLPEGRDRAARDALARISEYLEARIRSNTRQTLSDIEQAVHSQIVSESRARVSEAGVVDWHIEEHGGKSDVYVLTRISRGQIAQEKARLARDRMASADSARETYLAGKNLEDSGNCPAALPHYHNARSLLDESGGATGPGAGSLPAQIETSLRLCEDIAHRLKFSVEIPGPAERREIFLARLAAVLIPNGYTFADDGAGLHLTGKVSASSTGMFVGNHVSLAEGAVSVVAPKDGRRAASVPLNVKGLDPDRERSAMNALANAGEHAGKELVRILREMESAEAQNRQITLP